MLAFQEKKITTIASLPLTAIFLAMQIFINKKQVDSFLEIAESESPTAVVGGNVGGLSPLSSLSSAVTIAAALDDVAAEEEAAAAAALSSAPPAPVSSLPPFAEGSRLKILNRMGINVRPTNDMVVSFVFIYFCFSMG